MTCKVPLLWSHVCYECHTKRKACSFQISDLGAEGEKKRRGKRPGVGLGKLLWHWYKWYKFHSDVARFSGAGQQEPVFDPNAMPQEWFLQAVKQRGPRPAVQDVSGEAIVESRSRPVLQEVNGEAVNQRGPRPPSALLEVNDDARATTAIGFGEAQAEARDTSTPPRSLRSSIRRQRTRSVSRARSQSARSAASAPPTSPSPIPTDDEAAADETLMQVDLPTVAAAVPTAAVPTAAVSTAAASTAAVSTALPPVSSLEDFSWDDKEESPVSQDYTEAIAYDAVQQDLAADDAVPEDKRQHHHADKDSLTARLTVPELPGRATNR